MSRQLLDLQYDSHLANRNHQRNRFQNKYSPYHYKAGAKLLPLYFLPTLPDCVFICGKMPENIGWWFTFSLPSFHKPVLMTLLRQFSVCDAFSNIQPYTSLFFSSKFETQQLYSIEYQSINVNTFVHSINNRSFYQFNAIGYMNMPYQI